MLSGLPDCRLPAFKRNSPPQRPYTLCCWGVMPFAALQTRQPSAAAPHILFGVQATPGPASAPDRFFKPLHFRSSPYRLSCRGFKRAVCRPSIGSTLRSGPTQHCLVQTSQPSAVALHTVLLTLQGYRSRASQPLTHTFKPFNPPQRLYTLSC